MSMTNGSSLRDTILAAQDRPLHKLDIPEWGVAVYIRIMSASERDAFEARQQQDPYGDLRARMAVACACDETGEPIFSENDVKLVGAKSSKPLDRIFAAAVKHNGMTSEDVEEMRRSF